MSLKALLIDIDGTLVFKGQPIEGARQALQDLAQAGIAVRLLTNISARLPRQIRRELQNCGIDVDEACIQTAGLACASYIRRTPGASCHLLLPEAMETLFDGVRRDDVAPAFVVVGDVAERFDYTLLNRVFQMLHGGARLVVPHRNLYWFDGQGPPRLDAGAFILGLEAAAGMPAVVTGKPSPVFFQSALDALGVQAHEALVVGDDRATDIAGARAAGLASVLVHTGKGGTPAGEGAAVPDHQIPGIAHLLSMLRGAGLLAG